VKARLFAVWFKSPAPQYERMARVLEMTARRWCPGWDVSVQRVPPPVTRGSSADAANHYKLQAWAAAVERLPDGELLLLVDADTFITGSLDGVWDQAFDVAYTARPEGSRYPFNAGVIAVRGGAAARTFLAAWVAQDGAFLRDSAARRPWRQQYGGQNQASLGALLYGGAVTDASVKALPCARWNCEDTTWALFSEDTRIVHVKGALRSAAFGGHTPVGKDWLPVRHLAHLWRLLDSLAAPSPFLSRTEARAIEAEVAVA
jgi:hypothetical protein